MRRHAMRKCNIARSRIVGARPAGDRRPPADDRGADPGEARRPAEHAHRHPAEDAGREGQQHRHPHPAHLVAGTGGHVTTVKCAKRDRYSGCSAAVPARRPRRPAPGRRQEPPPNTEEPGQQPHRRGRHDHFRHPWALADERRLQLQDRTVRCAARCRSLLTTARAADLVSPQGHPPG